VPQDIQTHTLANGLTLLAERMPHVRSAAFHILVPAGAAHDPSGKHGLAGLVRSPDEAKRLRAKASHLRARLN